MKERPILFSGPMVRAILDGSKTQTRRVMRPQPQYTLGKDCGPMWGKGTAKRGWLNRNEPHPDWLASCPYGQPGDLLYVRESHWEWGMWQPREDDPKRRRFVPYYAPHMKARVEYGIRFSEEKPDRAPEPLHALGLDAWHRRPSIFLPKAASRIWQRNKGVRVERIQDISEADAVAEGVVNTGRRDGAPYDHFVFPGMVTEHDAVPVFGQLWDSSNAKRSPWSRNDWVWVVDTERIQP